VNTRITKQWQPLTMFILNCWFYPTMLSNLSFFWVRNACNLRV